MSISLIHINIVFGYLLHTSIMHVGAIIFFLLFLLFISGHFHISIYTHMCFTVESCVLYLGSWLLDQCVHMLFNHPFEINFIPWFWFWFLLSLLILFVSFLYWSLLFSLMPFIFYFISFYHTVPSYPSFQPNQWLFLLFSLCHIILSLLVSFTVLYMISW